jgi:hypothetical protein
MYLCYTSGCNTTSDFTRVQTQQPVTQGRRPDDGMQLLQEGQPFLSPSPAFLAHFMQ